MYFPRRMATVLSAELDTMNMEYFRIGEKEESFWDNVSWRK